MSRASGIRQKCLDCSGGNRADVANCTVIKCALYPYRMGKNPNTAKARSQAIKAECIWCCVNQWKLIKECGVETCGIYPYRPFQKRKSSDDDQDTGFMG